MISEMHNKGKNKTKERQMHNKGNNKTKERQMHNKGNNETKDGDKCITKETIRQKIETNA